MRKPIVFTGPRLVLSGARPTELADDDELAALLPEIANLEACELLHQPITKLPPLPPTLRELVLDDARRLTSLAGIEKLVGLTHLQLSHVPALDLARDLPRLAELPDLASLALAGASIRALPEAIALLPSLIALRISLVPELDIAQVARACAAAPALRTLTILPARGTHYPDDIGELTRVAQLALGRALSLPPAIGRLSQHLVHLTLQNAPLEHLPDELCDCAALEVLDLRGSQLVALPAAIGRLARLRVLDLDDTRLASLPASIGELSALRDLRVFSKRKVMVPDALFGLDLERFSGRDDLRRRIVLRPAAAPETDRVRVDDPARIPADFGAPVELAVALPGFLGELPQLARLARLQAAELELHERVLPGALQTLARGAPFLRRLALHGVRGRVPAEIGGFARVERLEIANGPVELLPDELGDLASLTVLAIARAPALAALPASIARCTALVDVAIDTTAIPVGAELAARLAGIAMLRSLRLARLRVDDLAAVIRALAGTRLERLDLGGLAITDLPDAIAPCAQLRWIGVPAAAAATAKAKLPRTGRWRTGRRRDLVWFERTI